MNISMDRWMDGRDGRKSNITNRERDNNREGTVNGSMDGWMDGWMDR